MIRKEMEWQENYIMLVTSLTDKQEYRYLKMDFGRTYIIVVGETVRCGSVLGAVISAKRSPL